MGHYFRHSVDMSSAIIVCAFWV